MSSAVSISVVARIEAAPANIPQLLPLSRLGPREVSLGLGAGYAMCAL